MIGHVDILRRPVLRIWVRGPFGARQLDACVDTGFNGHLAIPDGLPAQLGLRQRGAMLSRVADGRVASCPVYDAELEWVDGSQRCPTVTSELSCALIGTALLDDRQLHVDFGPAKSVEVR